MEMKPDEFMKVLTTRTNLCPHKAITPLAMYWIETISMFDGEMGFTLPYRIDKTPAMFFDALNIVRRAKHRAKDEDKDRK